MGQSRYVRRLVLNLFRLDTSQRKGGILPAASDSYRGHSSGSPIFDAIALNSLGKDNLL